QRPRTGEETDHAILRGASPFVAQTFCDVTQIGGEDGCSGDPERSDGELDLNFGPVRAHGRNLDATIEDWTFARFQVMGETAPMPLAERGWNNQFRQFLADRFRATESKNSLRGRIELDHTSVCIHGDDAIER